jgi:hypothetical protein
MTEVRAAATTAGVTLKAEAIGGNLELLRYPWPFQTFNAARLVAANRLNTKLSMA